MDNETVSGLLQQAEMHLQLGQHSESLAILRVIGADEEVLPIYRRYVHEIPFEIVEQVVSYYQAVLTDPDAVIEGSPGISLAISTLKAVDSVANLERGVALRKLGNALSLVESDWATNEAERAFAEADNSGVTEDLWGFRDFVDECDQRIWDSRYQTDEIVEEARSRAANVAGSASLLAWFIHMHDDPFEGAELLGSLNLDDPFFIGTCYEIMGTVAHSDFEGYWELTDQIDKMVFSWHYTLYEHDNRPIKSTPPQDSPFLAAAYLRYSQLREGWFRDLRKRSEPRYPHFRWLNRAARAEPTPLVDEDLQRYMAVLAEQTVTSTVGQLKHMLSRPLSIEERRKEITDLLAEDEGQLLEFKETFGYDIREQRGSKEIRHASLKTIVAFLNADGGTLLIGVSNAKQVAGLSPDLSLLSEKRRNLDFLEMSIRQRIEENITPTPYKLTFSFEHSAQVCRISVPPAPEGVVYSVNTPGNPGAIYVRTGNKTKLLEGRELVDWQQARQTNASDPAD